MFGSIGITEIIIMAGIALVVMGPEKFPDFARTVARMVRDVRGYVSDAQRDLEREMRPIKKEFDELSKVDPETYIDQLAKSAMGEGDDDDDDGNYNPEPEGPVVDGDTASGGDSEEKATDSGAEDEVPSAENDIPDGPEGTELYRD